MLGEEVATSSKDKKKAKRNLDSISSVSPDSDPVRHFSTIDHKTIREHIDKIFSTDSEYVVACKVLRSLKTLKEIQDQSALSLDKFKTTHECQLNNDGKFLLNLGIDRILASRYCAHLTERELEKHKKSMDQYVFPPESMDNMRSQAHSIIRDLDFLWDEGYLPKWK